MLLNTLLPVVLLSMCALDLSKAFDRTNHFGMYIRNYDGTQNSDWFIVNIWAVVSNVSYVRQVVRSNLVLFQTSHRGSTGWGSFSILICIIFGHCYWKSWSNLFGLLGNVCVCIFLYADDILLIALSATWLQMLLNACEFELSKLDMVVNIKKSMCLRFGPRFSVPCANIISVYGGFVAEPLTNTLACYYSVLIVTIHLK